MQHKQINAYVVREARSTAWVYSDPLESLWVAVFAHFRFRRWDALAVRVWQTTGVTALFHFLQSAFCNASAKLLVIGIFDLRVVLVFIFVFIVWGGRRGQREATEKEKERARERERGGGLSTTAGSLCFTT
jgi:hypothetical protein